MAAAYPLHTSIAATASVLSHAPAVFYNCGYALRVGGFALHAPALMGITNYFCHCQLLMRCSHAQWLGGVLLLVCFPAGDRVGYMLTAEMCITMVYYCLILVGFSHAPA